MAANNQGIMHLATKMGGQPVCRNLRAHMSTIGERFASDPKPCKKCLSIWEKWQAKKAKQGA